MGPGRPSRSRSSHRPGGAPTDLALHVSDCTSFGSPDSLAAGLGATAQAADEAGFSTLTLMDHWFQMEAMASAEDPMLEGYTTLGFLAARTERLRLGLLVTGVTYRHPGLLAKTVATLDVLSGGRALLGIGAAWYEREHLGLGVPFPTVSQRFQAHVTDPWALLGPGEMRHAALAYVLGLSKVRNQVKRRAACAMSAYGVPCWA